MENDYEIMIRFSKDDFEKMIEIVSKFDKVLAARIIERRYKCTPEAERAYERGYADGTRDHTPERHEMGG